MIVKNSDPCEGHGKKGMDIRKQRGIKWFSLFSQEDSFHTIQSWPVTQWLQFGNIWPSSDPLTDFLPVRSAAQFLANIKSYSYADWDKVCCVTSYLPLADDVLTNPSTSWRRFPRCTKTVRSLATRTKGEAEAISSFTTTHPILNNEIKQIFNLLD